MKYISGENGSSKLLFIFRLSNIYILLLFYLIYYIALIFKYKPIHILSLYRVIVCFQIKQYLIKIDVV